MKSLSHLFVGTCLLAFASTASAVMFPHTVDLQKDDVFEFCLVITGTVITEDNDDSVVNVPVNSNNWTVTDLKLDPDDATFNDELQITGKIYHKGFLVAPDHIHRGGGGEWEFSLYVNADDQVGGFVNDSKSQQEKHGKHIDDYSAVLSAKSDGDEITQWRFTLKGTHRGSLVPDSGPSVAAFGSLLGLLFLSARVRRRNDQK